MAVISNSDLSTLRDTLNTILNGTGVGGGYNQSHSVQANPAAGDLIDTSTFTATSGITIDSNSKAANEKSVTVILSGGTAGTTYTIKSTIAVII